MTFFFTLVFCLFLTVSANADATPAAVEENAGQPENVSAEPEKPQKPSELSGLFEKMKNRKRPSLSFKTVSTQGTETKTFNVYTKNDKWRLETSVYEGSLNKVSRIVVLSDGKETFIYAPSVHIATKGEFPEMNLMNELTNLDLSTYVTKGETTVNGYKCRLLTSEKDGSEICFSEQFLLPVAFRSGTNSILLSDISEQPVSDDSFVLPTDVYVF